MAVFHARPILSPVLSESAQSQILNDDDSDEEVGFATQYPLASITQASFPPRGTSSVVRAPSSTQSHNSNRTSPPEQKSQQQRHVPGHEQPQADVPHSSAESIPFETLSQHVASPIQDSGAIESYPVRGHGLDGSHGPLPLIEQLRAIRKGTNYTNTLGWAKHIESSQRRILESNEAWQPPLPGKVPRDGTVPVALLARLSSKADQEADGPVKHGAFANGTQTQDVYAEADTVSSVVNHKASLSHVKITSKEPCVPEVFVDSQEWPASASPEPHNVLPPDSSPLRPSSRRVPHHPKLTDDQGPPSLITQPNANDETLSSLQDQNQVVDDGQCLVDAHLTLNSLERPPAIRGPGVSNLLLSTVSARDSSDKHNERRNATRTPPATIQAKRTPYMARSPKIRSHNLDEPISSVVDSTYIEHKSPPKDLTAASLLLEQPRTQIPLQEFQDPALSKNSTYQNRTEVTSRKNTSSPDEKHGKMAQQLASSKRQRQSLDASSPLKAPSSSKRRKLPWAVTNHVKDKTRSEDYGDLDRQRELLRRQFYKEHSKQRLRPVDSPQNRRPSHHFTIRPVSVGSSSPLDALEMPDSSTDVPQTPETSSPMHNSPSSDEPLHKALILSTSREASEVQDIQDLLSSYRAVYKSYVGNSKHFRAALQLLSRLRHEKREPHPALWDDFVFRKHSSYRRYLRQCIEDGESAMPYEKFYHERVPQPKYLGKVLTPASLEATITTSANPREISTSNVQTMNRMQTPQHYKLASDDKNETWKSKDGGTDDEANTSKQVMFQDTQGERTNSSNRARTQILTDSSRKVSTWLRRAPGAQSPELGSSEIPDQNELPVNTTALTKGNLCENAVQANEKSSTDRVAEKAQLDHRVANDVIQSMVSPNSVLLEFVDKYKKLPNEQSNFTTRSWSFNIYDW